jgi:hypothetical protein
MGKDCHWRGIPSRKRVRPRGRWGFDSLSFRLADPFRRGRAVRRATVNREAQVRALPPELRRSVSVAARLPDMEQGLVRFQDLRLAACPRGRAVVTPGSQPGGAGSTPAGGSEFLLAVGEMATPPASGAGDRWFDSSRPDCAVGNWRPASLMSSRSRFDSCRRYLGT